MNVPKALAAVSSVCSLHVILLSKMTPRYLTLFTNGMFRPFSWRSSPGFQIAWIFPSLIFMFQRWHHDPTAVRPRWNLFNTRRSCFSVAYTQVSSANRAMCIPCAAGTSFMYKLHSTRGKEGTLWHPCRYFPGRRKFAFYWNFNFLSRLSYNRYPLYKLHTDHIFCSWLLLLWRTQLKVVYMSLHRNGDSLIVALRVFDREVLTGPLPSNALAIHVTIS
jgi:hypothetical protein